MEEHWKPVVGYESIYMVSSMGNVKRVAPTNNQYKVGHMLRHNKIKGYSHVQLHSGGSVRQKRVHRLVAEAFIPNPNNKLEVNHINGIKDDNRIENLEWVTRSENELHAFRVLGKTTYKHIIPPDTLRLMIILFDGGVPLDALSEKYGFPKHTIHKRIFTACKRKGRKGEFSNFAKLRREDLTVIRAMRERGMSYVEIAAEYKVSYQTISRVCNNIGWKE